MASITNSRILKKMGYLADQEGIIRRYLREQGGWDSHLLRCREYILERVKKQSLPDVTILGSGWLLDVPLEELSELCSSITLIDINHPSQIRRKVKQYSNVRLIKDDITGGLIEKVWQMSRRKIDTLDTIGIPVYKFDFNPGLIISLNLLTQTDTLLNDFLIKKTKINIEEHRRFRKRVQEAHIALLNNYPHLLVTDFEEEIIDIEEDLVIETNQLIFCEIPAGNNRQEWSWIFDSTGEYYMRRRVSFKVMAIDNSKK